MYICIYVYMYIYILGGDCRLTMLVVPVKGRTRSESGCERTLQSEKVQRVLCSYASCVGWLARGPWLQHRHRRNERDDHQCTNLDRKSSQKSLRKGSQRPQGEPKNESKTLQNRFGASLGRSWASWGSFGTLRGRSGDAPGLTWDAQGSSRDAPGTPPGQPGRPQERPKGDQRVPKMRRFVARLH